MMIIQKNVDLQPFNTFRLSAEARLFTTVSSIKNAQAVFSSETFRQNKFLIMGGGSNMLLTGDFDGLLIKNEVKGIEVVKEDEQSITLKVGSGENWHEFVRYCVDRNYGGVENLSLIPGTVGAAPMQNIGAYGVEIKDVIDSVEAINIESGALENFSKEECAFAYRESVFKHELKNKYFISSITLTLTKTNHRFNTTYGAISEVIKSQFNDEISVKTISDSVISIRKSKLPDPNIIGNAGSFFKNPSIDARHFNELKLKHPSIPSFPGENGHIKVPAAWLIEQCGWKGKTFDNIGVHKLQALVLVNYGGGEGQKIWELAMKIQSSVRETFNITLHPEVNVI
jgi:UDP-N-acetylmuramate dehydrogenase